jgi:hypothetical protein
MSFSAQTCITNTGTTQLGPTLYFYSDISGYQGSFGSDSTQNLIGNNCPYTMQNIPDGTTVVRIIDPTTNCCLNINLQSNDLCNTYNLNFDVYDTQTVSQIVAGNLIGDNVDVTDYIISWYGPGEGSTELAFTSGYGTEFSDIGWDLTHPLTGSSSPIIEAGVYTPVIDRVVVNGTSFSLTGSPDTYIANLDCFTSALVTVDAIKCDNGNLPSGSIYSHLFQFNNASVGITPIGLSASFELSSTTNYIAWKFKGFDVFDTLKMTFYGSSYSVPLIIENVRVGLNAGQFDVRAGSNPKIVPSQDFLRKVTCLTGLTINEGDYVTINITPNTTNNNTIWSLELKCLEEFDCTTCFDQFESSMAKIYSANTSAELISCNRVQITTKISGCTYQDFTQTDVGKYLSQQNSLGANYNTQIVTVSTPFTLNPLGFGNPFCTYSFNNLNGYPAVCTSPSASTYSFSKTNIESGQGFIEFNFQSFSDLSFYYSYYLTTIQNMNGSFDNTNINYYKFFILSVPNNSDPNENCGDETNVVSFSIHHTSVVTTGGTGPWFMTLTMPTIQNNISFDNCTLNCTTNINYVVNNVNIDSLSSSNIITINTNTSSKYINPFGIYRGVSYYSGTPQTYTFASFYLKTNWNFENETYVYSADNSNNLILITSLTGKTCQNKGLTYNLSDNRGFQDIIYSNSYRYELTDINNNLLSFNVLAPNLSNYILSDNFPNTAMTVVNNVVTYANPNYCI